jgi:hypothetical protein
MADKPVVVDYTTRFCAGNMQPLFDMVWDGLGESPVPTSVRTHIGAMGLDPDDGAAYVSQNNAWVALTPTLVDTQWGDIGGTLANQTDLDAALDALAVAFAGAGTSGPVPDPVTESSRFLRDDGSWVGTSATARKNLLINGNFDLWERATSQTTTAYGSDDRWRNSHSGSTTKTHSRQTFTLGQTDVPGNPKYYSRTVVATGSGAGDYCLKSQRIESVLTSAGKTVAVSFWAKADAAKDVSIEFFQSFGTGGSPSTIVTAIGVTKFSLTTSWAKYTATASIPSIAGKTLGTDGNDYLAFSIWLDAGSTYDSQTDTLGNQSGTFDIAQVQVEIGDAVTEFERRPIAEETALCRRYYRKLVVNGNQSGSRYSAASAGFMAGLFGQIAPIMRASPTMTLSSFTYTNCSLNDAVATADFFSVRVDKNATAGTYRCYGTIALDAEL